ncbi:MAG: type II and III secretion system protein family protein [Oceanococcaceae bacterium]
MIAPVRILGLALVLLLSGVAGAQLEAPPSEPVRGGVLTVEEGTDRLLPQRNVQRIAVGNPEIADVSVISRRELLITGKKQGVTSLLLWYANSGETATYKLVVTSVTDPLAPSESDESVAAVRITPERMDGRLSNLPSHSRARKRAGDEAVDTSYVALPSQVMTEIRIAEVSRSSLKQYGFNFLLNRLDGSVAIGRPGTLGGAQLGAPPNGAEPFTAPVVFGSDSGFLPLQNAFNIVLGNASRNVLGFLSLLENQGLVRTLAEPSLVATSGQTASFLAGGEFPVPISQGGTSGAITIEYKEFGVRLSLTPTVLSADRISLRVAPEVSELDFSAGVSIGGTSVPALAVRRTDTVIELGDGESFVISGLVSRNMMANVDKVPFIGDVPILGAFFRSSRYDREERELVMVVTPHLVSAIPKDAERPALPGDDYENYRPGFGELLFQERGRFDAGLSR